MGRRRVRFIANPRARGLARERRLDQAVALVASERDLEAELVWTERAGHATALARAAADDGVDLIFACGGDGTLNEVLNGLDGLDARTAPPVGLVPAGTANVWAREAGIPRGRPAAAIRAQLDAPPLHLDLGRIVAPGEPPRRFLLMASLGFDAEAVASVNPGLKRRIGGLAYVWSGLKSFWRHPGFELDLRLDGGAPERLQPSMLVVGNTRNYGGSAAFTAAASAIDGQLDFVGVRRGFWSTLRLLPRLLLRRHLGARPVFFRRGARGELTAPAGSLLPHLQLDGEIGLPPSSGPMTLSVEPLAVRMLIPKPDQALFETPRDAPAG